MQQDYWKSVAVTLFVSVAATLGTDCKAKEGKDSSAVAVNSPAPTASPMAGHGGMASSSPSAANSPFDLQFIDTMSAHHQGAIDMAQPAESKAQKAELKSFARKIVENQQRQIAQMKQWRDNSYSGRPHALNMEMPVMMDSMNGMNTQVSMRSSGLPRVLSGRREWWRNPPFPFSRETGLWLTKVIS